MPCDFGFFLLFFEIIIIILIVAAKKKKICFTPSNYILVVCTIVLMYTNLFLKNEFLRQKKVQYRLQEYLKMQECMPLEFFTF